MVTLWSDPVELALQAVDHHHPNLLEPLVEVGAHVGAGGVPRLEGDDRVEERVAERDGGEGAERAEEASLRGRHGAIMYPVDESQKPGRNTQNPALVRDYVASDDD